MHAPSMQGRNLASAANLCALALRSLATAMFHSNYNNGKTAGILHGKTSFFLAASNMMQRTCKTKRS